MAKSKVKMMPIETRCEEVKPGQWEFTTGRFRWWFQMGHGINLRMRAVEGKNQSDGDDSWRGTIFAETLRDAVMFAQGYESGRQGK
jgi:hypothetical protein